MNNESQIKDKSHTISSWGLLKYVIKGNERKFIIAAITHISANAFAVALNPILIKYIFDEGIIRGDFQFFIFLGIASVLIFTLWRIWGYFNRLYIQKLKVKVSEQTCTRLMSRYYEMPYNEILRKDSGYFVSRMYDEVLSTCHPTIDTFISLFSTIVSLIVAIIIAMAMSWRASLTLIISLPIIYLVTTKYSKKVKRLSKEEKEKEALLKGTVTQSVNSFKFAKIFNLKSFVITNFGNFYTKYAKANISRFRNSTKYETISSTLMSYTETIAIIGAGYEILVGRMTFGTFMGFMQAYWGVIGSVRTLFVLSPEISRLIGSAERIIEFENTKYENTNIVESDFLQLKEMSFGFDKKAVLEDISLDFKNSERILIIGSNGSGKSTLAHIVSGILSPDKGSIFTFPLSRISAIIYPFDFVPGSVADNLSFIKSESEKLRFDEICQSFGFNNELDKDISQFSAGQRKKLEVMVGLVKDADIYIFDEPLSGIDVESKEVIMQEIFKHTEGKILMVVLHGDEQFYQEFDRQIRLDSNKNLYLNEVKM